LTKRQELKLQRVATLMDTLTQTEARRIQLESELKLLERTGQQPPAPQELLKMRQDYITADPTIKALAEKLAEMEMELVLARQTMAPDHPEIKKKISLLQALKRRLDEEKREIARSFDDLMAKENRKATQQKLVRLRAEYEQLKETEQRLRAMLDHEDAETIKLGRQQLELQDLQRQMELDQQLYDTICRRIKELELEARRISERPKPELGPEVLPAPRELEIPQLEPVPAAPAPHTFERLEVEPAPEAPPAVTPSALKAQEN